MFLSLVLFMGTSVSCMQAQPLYKIQANMTDSVTHAETSLNPSYIVASCPLLNPMGTLSLSNKD